jgi:hypothetical protein
MSGFPQAGQVKKFNIISDLQNQSNFTILLNLKLQALWKWIYCTARQLSTHSNL